MSSIYRKGRDGYYYYQAYVRDPDTGKKDKRIFHSLKTKDQEEAVRKQIILDEKYKSHNNISKNKPVEWFKKNKRIFLIIIFTSIITLYMDELIKPKAKSINIIPNKPNPGQASKIIDIQTDTTEIIIIKEKREDEVPIITENHTLKIQKLPSYKVERLERLAGSFDQEKIFLTVEKNSGSQNLQLLCEKIMNDYSEFSNIVICLYSSDSIGKNLANGYDVKVGLEEIKKSWLAMYTYNSVEGAYFDDKPSSYLGLNN